MQADAGWRHNLLVTGRVIINWLNKLLSPTQRATLTLRLFGLRKIPLLLFVRPTVTAISSQRIVVLLPLKRRNKNHWGSMYFGALNIGADCASGLLVMQLIAQRGVPISLIFKDCHAEFHKRAMDDVAFTCEQGDEIAQLIEQAATTGKRVEMPVRVVASVPSLADEVVATFTLTLSLKRSA